MKSLYLFLCTAILLTKQYQCLKYDNNEYDNNISYQLSDIESDDNTSDNNNSEQIISDKSLTNFIKRLLMKSSKSLINHQLINKLSNTTTSTLSLIKHNKRFTNDNKETRDPDRVTRNEDFLGSRGRRQHDSSVMIDHEKKFSNDFLGSRGKKFEEFLGSRGRRHDEEFLGSRGRRTDKNDNRVDHSINRRINEEFLGSRGRRMDDFLGSRGKRYDEFYGSRGRRNNYLTSIDCQNTNYCDENDLSNDNLLNGYDNNYLKQHLHQQLFNDENSLTMLINKKSNKNNQQTRVDTQIVREPFWAHRGKKDHDYHRHHVNNIWHNDVLMADEPYWILVMDDQITTTQQRQTKNNNHLSSAPFINDNGPESTDSTFTVLNNDKPFILSRG